jgi:O-antigen ligase
VVIASSFVQSKEKENFILSGYVLSASTAAAVGVLQPFFGKSFELPFNIQTYYVFSTGFVSQSNSFAEIMTFSTIAALYLLYTTTKKHQKILLATGIIIMFLATIFSRARASITVFAIILIIFIPFILRKDAFYFFGIIFAIMLILSPYTKRIFWRFDNILSSSGSRVELWEKSLEVFYKHPVIGCGIGNLQNNLLQKRDTIKHKKILSLTHSHNNLIDLLSTTGTLGFIAFVLFWGAVIKDIIVQIKNSTDNQKALHIAILTAVIAFHLVGMVNCNYKTAITAFQVYLFVGMFYGLKEKSVA